MSELVMISKDGFPCSNVWVKEKSIISNNLQSTFLIVLNRKTDHCCKWDSGAKNMKLIQLQHRTSSIVNGIIRTILSQFFFSEKILGVQKTPKLKTNNFHPLRSFYARKKHCLYCFLFVYLFIFLLVGFGWFAFLCTQKLFVKKSLLEIVLITSFTILLMCTPINPPIENLFVHTYFYMWSSVRTSSFYDNLFESLLIYDHLWESIF